MDTDQLKKIRKRLGLTQADVAEKLGITQAHYSQMEKGLRNITPGTLERITKVFRIEMEKAKIEPNILVDPDAGIVFSGISGQGSKKNVLIPYFDVDVMATPIEVFNDQTTVPTYRIDMPGFSDCDFAINVYGHSMYPTIESGMIVFCKKVERGLFLFGEIYFIVTEDYRMVKRIKKAEKEGFVLAVSDNHNGHDSPSGIRYDAIEIPVTSILHVYLVKGVIKRTAL